jgi:CO/xanthine dehydrogenase FAD-binding subunit
MDFLRPPTWDEALRLRADHPDALPVHGGTDVMVDLNFDRRRPAALLDLTGIPDLAQWTETGGVVRLGAGVPYRRIIDELGDRLPGLAMAARTVGSPQIRNRGTVGGNLGSASPAGDAHPPLLAAGASVELVSVRGTRMVPVDDFYTGVKRSVLAPDELIASVRIPVAAGPQQFAKVGTRNAMVIAVCSIAVALDPGAVGLSGGGAARSAGGSGGGLVGAAGGVRVAIGSAAPTPRRCPDAESFLPGELVDRRLWTSRAALPEAVVRRFGELVAAAAVPIDDVRGSAAYRRHALGVLARRALGWAWQDYRGGDGGRWPACA